MTARSASAIGPSGGARGSAWSSTTLFDHEAWNHTDEDRIVLIVDLWHPGLSDAEVRLLEGLHAYTYRHARRLSRYWAANVAAAREPDREAVHLGLDAMARGASSRAR